MIRKIRHLSVSGRAAQEKILYLKTLSLPHTNFSPKLPNSEERSQLIESSAKQLYQWQKNRSEYSRTFIIHDGPPYANGDLHLGHSLNKVLKDIINRFELIHNNCKVNYVPGWDCHGLPIEMKAIEGQENLEAPEIRQRCRQLAQSMIEKQKEQFLDFGIMTDFDNIYVTMSHLYESAQLEIFLKLYLNGLLSRQLKPVWWGCETQTALAEAELEYNPKHKSVAAYVKFPLEGCDLPSQWGSNLSLLIWTSTPWTIPANKAICVNRGLTYTIIESEKGERLIVEEGLASSLIKLNPSYSKSCITIRGSELENLWYRNPSNQTDERYPVLHGDHVSSMAGTGLVHTSPAHGMEDFLIGRANGLSAASLVDEKGLYIQEIIPKGYHDLAGKYANGKKTISAVIQKLDDAQMIFKVDKNHAHSYPYDWRSKTPVIQRATPQWFINVEKIKDAALQLLEKVDFVPEVGKNRLSAFVKNRSEWCISRQRSWGVPMPIVYDKKTHEPLDNLEVITHIVSQLQSLGTDAWFTSEKDISRWIPQKYNGTSYYKGKDTMDVWFDSGTSWSILPGANSGNDEAKPLADIYLEGSDQHRGWFQSSLLNKIISTGEEGKFTPVAPYKKIITHGFTLDKQNDKMSKSKGNVIEPRHVINGSSKPFVPALGVDGLRLWVASSNYTQDISVSQEVLKRVLENVRKLRVTFKYLLGNLQDFEQPVPYNKLSKIDEWVLIRLRKLEKSVIEAYTSHNFARVVREMNSHIATDLSALYFDISKDCLYTHEKNCIRRRAIQTVLAQVLKTYVGLLSPIQPLLTQEVWDLYAGFSSNEVSPFMKTWDFFKVPEHGNPEVEEEMQLIWDMRNLLYKEFETLRLEGLFKNKLLAEILLHASGEAEKILKSHSQFLDDYFLVSKVRIKDNLEHFDSNHKVTMEHPRGNVTAIIRESTSYKCPRCWKFTAEGRDEICHKCAQVLCK